MDRTSYQRVAERTADAFLKIASRELHEITTLDRERINEVWQAVSQAIFELMQAELPQKKDDMGSLMERLESYIYKGGEKNNK